MPNGLKSNVKQFADNTSNFTIVKKKMTAKDLNHDLSLISKWTFKWKMLFNPDPTKPAQEVIFSRKKDMTHLIQIYFLMYTSRKSFTPKTTWNISRRKNKFQNAY